MPPPSGRLAAFRDTLPPSSPEFSICKPYHDDEPEPKRRKGSRISKTYSERSRRLPTIPSAIGSLGDGIGGRAADGYVSASSSMRDPVSSDSVGPFSISSPPSSPPMHVRTSPRKSEARPALAPIFLSINERRGTCKAEGKSEEDVERETLPKKDESEQPVAIVSISSNHNTHRTPTISQDIAGHGKQGTRREGSRHGERDSKAERSVQAEPADLMGKAEVKAAAKVEQPQARKAWPIFSMMARNLQPGASKKNQPPGKHEPRASGQDEAANEQDRGSRNTSIPSRHDMKHEPTTISLSAVLDSSTRPAVSCQESPAERDGPAIDVNPNQATSKIRVKDHAHNVRHSPVFQQTSTEPAQRSIEMRRDHGIASVQASRQAPEKPCSDALIQNNPAQPTLHGRLPYDRPYKEYLEASREKNAEDAATSNRPKKPTRKVQTTLNLSTKLAFKECKLCDTVYNPLHPADVKLHQDVHDQVVRATGLGDWAHAKKRKRP